MIQVPVLVTLGAVKIYTVTAFDLNCQDSLQISVSTKATILNEKELLLDVHGCLHASVCGDSCSLYQALIVICIISDDQFFLCRYEVTFRQEPV